VQIIFFLPLLLFFSTHAIKGGLPDSPAFRHCGQSLSLRGFTTRGAGALLGFFEPANHFKIDLVWKIICKHKTIAAIKNIVNES
jgi:hypothetical protein